LKNRKIIEKLKKRFLATEARQNLRNEQKLMNDVAVTRFRSRPRQNPAEDQ
jgi:hypothetical protein